MYAEARRFAQALPSPTEEAAAMDSLAGLNAQGISQAERRRLAHRQATIMKYIAVRLRPLVRVSDETIRQALKQKQADHNEAEVRERLVQRELDLRVEEWAHRLREGASIDYPDPRDAPAP
jgi:FKBP-type peptidyl-prolyl cis-trans isomerase (trigger factor)